MKTFKEQLIEKADFGRYDISEHVEKIKLKMEACALDREFTISLVQVKPGYTVAFGLTKGPTYQTFIPDEIEPHIYMKLFIEALEELGFKGKDIETGAGANKNCYYYIIKVKW